TLVGAARDARLYDPASKKTIRLQVPGRPPADHRAHTSTTAQPWSCRGPEPAPAPAYHQHAISPPLSRSGAATPPTVPATGSSGPPSRPWSNAPARLLLARRSPTDDRAASDRHTWTPARVPAVPVPPGPVLWVGSAPLLAQCGRIPRSLVWAEHAGSRESARGCTPA